MVEKRETPIGTYYMDACRHSAIRLRLAHWWPRLHQSHPVVCIHPRSDGPIGVAMTTLGVMAFGGDRHYEALYNRDLP